MKKFLIGFLLAALVFGGLSLRAGDITSTGMNQGDLYTFLSNVVTMSNALKSSLNAADVTAAEATVRHNMVSGGLAAGTADNSFLTASAISYMIGGKLYNKAATDNVAPTACTAQSASRYRLYLVTIDAAGNFTVTAGTEQATDVAVLPAVPSTGAPVGAFKIQTGAGGTFTMGSANLAVAGNIAAITFYNFVGPILETNYTFTQTTVSTTDLTLSGL